MAEGGEFGSRRIAGVSLAGRDVGLASALDETLRNHLADVVKGERLAQCGVFDRARLRQIVDDHQAGRRDYSATLWSLLMFDGFLQKHGAGVSSPEGLERRVGAA